MSHGTKRNTQNFGFLNNRLSFHIAPAESVSNVGLLFQLQSQREVFVNVTSCNI
jgi:hypothetical protein